MLYKNINPLREIALQYSALRNRSTWDNLTKTDRLKARYRCAGLVDAARWILMAQQEQTTGTPIPIWADNVVEVHLGDIAREALIPA